MQRIHHRKEIIKALPCEVINDSGGIAKTSEFLAAGLYKSDIGKLVNDGLLERIRHGFYQFAGNLDITEMADSLFN